MPSSSIDQFPNPPALPSRAEQMYLDVLLQSVQMDVLERVDLLDMSPSGIERLDEMIGVLGTLTTFWDVQDQVCVCLMYFNANHY